jgi:hypothetical protein
MNQFVQLFRILSARQAASLVPIRPFLLGSSVFLALYIGLALMMVPAGQGIAYHFYDERGSITAMSAILLGWASAFAGLTYWLVRGIEGHRPAFWLLASAGLLFLSIDELVGFHELVAEALPGLSTTGEMVFGVFRGWDDIIIILYGIAAVAICLRYLPEVLRLPLVAEVMGLAFAAYAVHTFIDAVAEPPSYATVIMEESAKLYCTLFLASAMLAAVLGAWKRATETQGGSRGGLAARRSDP